MNALMNFSLYRPFILTSMNRWAKFSECAGDYGAYRGPAKSEQRRSYQAKLENLGRLGVNLVNVLDRK
jgi:hypothetical protein